MATETVHDPVCHMDITAESAKGTSEYQGKTYYFCAPGCKHDFDDDPAGILEAEATFDHSQSMEQGTGAARATPKKQKPWWQFWP